MYVNISHVYHCKIFVDKFTPNMMLQKGSNKILRIWHWPLLKLSFKYSLFYAIFWLGAALGPLSVLFMKGMHFSTKNAHLLNSLIELITHQKGWLTSVRFFGGGGDISLSYQWDPDLWTFFYLVLHFYYLVKLVMQSIC